MKIPACSPFLGLRAPQLVSRTAAEPQKQHTHSSQVLGRKTLLTWNPTNMSCQRPGGTWHGGSAQVTSEGATARIAWEQPSEKDPVPSPWLHPHVRERHTDEQESYGVSTQEHPTHTHVRFDIHPPWERAEAAPVRPGEGRRLQESRYWGAKADPSSKAERKAPRGEWEHALRWQAGQRSDQ